MSSFTPLDVVLLLLAIGLSIFGIFGARRRGPGDDVSAVSRANAPLPPSPPKPLTAVGIFWAVLGALAAFFIVGGILYGIVAGAASN